MTTPNLPSASETLAIVKPSKARKVEHELVLDEATGTYVAWQTTNLASGEVTTIDITPSEDEEEQSLEDAIAATQDVVEGSLVLQDDGVFRRIVTLEKQGGRRLDEAKRTVQVEQIAAAGLNADRIKRGWSVTVQRANGPDSPIAFTEDGSPQDGWTYTATLAVECRPQRVRRTLPMEVENIISAIDAKAQLPGNRWRVAYVDSKPYVPADASKITADPNEELGYAPFDLPDVHEGECDARCYSGERRCWIANFSHLYGLEDYIEIIRSTLELAVMSEWQDRVNIALIGPPACGKTELCKAVRRAVGDESVLEYDATSTSMAGAQEQIGNLEELPRVLVLEEIEKAPEAALPWLLSVMDMRGEVRKKTARSEINKSVHMVVICTVNDEEKFSKVASGALASRFSMPLYFSRPTREVLWKILKREVDKIGGSVAWIDPAIEFAEELEEAGKKVNSNLYIDPRKLIAICLTGRERLLYAPDDPRSFQGMYRRTMRRATQPTGGA